jgi:probable rRNA maturation factor
MNAESSSTSGPQPGPAPRGLEVAVLIQDDRWQQELPAAERCARRAAETAWAGLPDPVRPDAPAGAEVSVVLADDATVHALNRDYRGHDKPTNVLSFANLEDAEAPEAPAGEPVLLGDVVLARETVLGEAAEQGKRAEHHLSHLCVHGLLHLLGYDHLAEADAAAMEDLERRILDRLGIADPYAISDRAGGAA